MKFLFLLLFLLPLTSPACMQGGAPDKTTFLPSEPGLRLIMKDSPSSRGNLKMPINKGKASIYENTAINLIYAGKAAEAIPYLLAVEKIQPKRYATAANLGTAYELAGENEKALLWISEGLKRDPNSHRNSEWIHVLVLKAKIASANDRHSPRERLMPVPDQITKDEILTFDNQSYTAAEVHGTLLYQLHERMLFVKPKDFYVAEMLYSLAILEANLYSPVDAIPLLQLSKEYGFADEALLADQSRIFEELIKKEALKSPAALYR